MSMSKPSALALALVPLALLAGCEVSFLYGGSDTVLASTSTTGSVSATGSGGAGGTGGAATSGLGGGMICTAGATTSCYDGPAGTEGVGICKAGTQTCAADGASWGPCIGEVVPQPANCASGMDLHCDGKVQACKGTPLWAKRFGDPNDQRAIGVASTAAGDAVVAGNFAGSLDFGNGIPLVSPSGASAFVAQLDGASGGYRWANSFGGGAARGVAVDAAGNVLVVGYFSGAADFGGGTVTSTGVRDAFVVELDPGGLYKWSRNFGAPGAFALGTGIALSATGDVLVTGYFQGAINFGGGGGPVTSAGAQDVFVAKLDGSSGGYLWAQHFGGPTDQAPQSGGIAVDSSGNVVVTGYFLGSTDFGGGPLASTGASDVFVVKLNASGAHLWSKHFGGSGSLSSGRSVAVDASGVLVAGGFSGPLDFGGGPITASGSADAFLLKLDAASGAHVWSQHFGAGPMSSITAASGVTVDVAGNLLVTGDFTGAVKFGGPPILSAGVQDVFLAKLEPGGGDVWSERFGDPGSTQTSAGVATDASNNVLVAGYFSGSIDFGPGPLVSMGAMDIFVAKFAP
jgi:hypothetical protein